MNPICVAMGVPKVASTECSVFSLNRISVSIYRFSQNISFVSISFSHVLSAAFLGTPDFRLITEFSQCTVSLACLFCFALLSICQFTNFS